ncbi:RNA polymerase sigma factor [Amycolatopsis sp. SID8362]|uniref:RNA polymerase sigma factor n=1 Tax=Amycolatopsis sp. SID8362 TaxID=2690346 RepID=UPI0013688B1B|nr:RNA polymerase sigma factor [Amycolatopsis sp. SID8362]NBH06204.1 sigma-70 family RNA polymerase sigma factor [Amycolatopsis sp. SID8362]NED42903.1 sigma-70 family RNA polymerase sigma factor [Amycolatopsis sp. SID8362]
MPVAQRFRRKRAEQAEQDEAGAAPRPRLHAVGADVYPDWEAVYRDNVDRVFRLMFSKVGNRPDAEDLTTEVFLTALRPLRVSASVGEVRAYLLATARTVLAGHWRRTLGREITTLDEEHDVAAFEAGTVDPGVLARAEAILARLPERYGRILRLRFLQACSLKEAAEQLGTTVGNAKVLQHRALRQAAQLAEGMDT